MPVQAGGSVGILLDFQVGYTSMEGSQGIDSWAMSKVRYGQCVAPSLSELSAVSDLVERPKSSVSQTSIQASLWYDCTRAPT
jgi:hypothetical protein